MEFARDCIDGLSEAAVTAFVAVCGFTPAQRRELGVEPSPKPVKRCSPARRQRTVLRLVHSK